MEWSFSFLVKIRVARSKAPAMGENKNIKNVFGTILHHITFISPRIYKSSCTANFSEKEKNRK